MEMKIYYVVHIPLGGDITYKAGPFGDYLEAVQEAAWGNARSGKNDYDVVESVVQVQSKE